MTATVLERPPATRGPELVEAPVASPGRKRRRPRLARWWFALAFAVYVVLGALLAFHFDSFNGDAQARVGNAYYVLFSRDPHLAAIGFVWNPLPSMSVLPVLVFSKLWPALAARAFAGNIVSALFMAGTVVTVRGILADLRVRRTEAVLLTLLFAAHPMVVYYGANGMSEGLFLFLLTVATRQLMRYLETGATRPLLGTALALGFAYYARNEAVAAIALVTFLVFAVQLRRSAGTRRERIRAGFADAVVVVLPGFFAFVTWAVASWVIVRHPFEQFSSRYGTASQLGAMTAVGFKLADKGLAMRMTLLMAPLLVAVVVLAGRRVLRRRDLRLLAPMAVLGAVLGFALFAYLTGQTAGWFRYFITAAPLLVLLTGGLLAPPGVGTARRTGTQAPARPRRSAYPAIAVAALVLPSLLGEGIAMADPRIGQEEYLHLSHVFRPGPRPTDALAPTPRARSLRERELHPSSERIARYLDGLHLRQGSIVTDTFSPCIPFIVLASHHPTQFVITNDRDFHQILDSPSTFHAKYVLAPADGTLADLDAINRAYPTLATDGGGIVQPTPAKEFHEIGCPVFRLYSVIDQ